MKINRLLKNKIVLILVFFLIAKLLFLLTKYHMPGWDEAVYIGMAKYIYSSAQSGLWENIRPLGLPIMIGLFWKLGLNIILFSELLMILLSMGCIYLTYKISVKLFDEKTGLLAAAFLAISPLFFAYSGHILTEIPSTFFSLAAIYYFIDNKNFFAGIMAGLAFLTRFPQGIIFFSLCVILLYIVIRQVISTSQAKGGPHTLPTKIFISVKPMLFLISGFLIIITPFLIFNYIAYNQYSENILEASLMTFTSALPHQNNLFFAVSGDNTVVAIIKNLLYYPILIMINFPVLALSLIGLVYFWIIIFKEGNKKIQKNLSILIVSTTIILSYLTWSINKQMRFLLTVLPFLCIIAAGLFFQVYAKTCGSYGSKKVKRRKISWNWRNLIRGYKITHFTIILLLIVISFAMAAVVDINNYFGSRQIGSKPAVVNDVFQYFDRTNITGPIIITNPGAAAYSDRLFMPAYDTLGEESTFLNPWTNKIPIGGAIYSKDAFPCDDDICRDLVIKKKSQLTEGMQQVFNGTYEGVSFEIYQR